MSLPWPIELEEQCAVDFCGATASRTVWGDL